MLQEKFNILLQFVKNSTKHFDESHNHEHALKVYHTTINIMNSYGWEYDVELATYSAMLHDVRDHKYPNSISQEDLEAFLFVEIGSKKGKQVLNIIEHVSFSKEDQQRKNNIFVCDISDDLFPYLVALRDADRLEALGEVGIRRCEQFVLAHGGKIPEDVVKHCKEKLLRLYNEYFIVTEFARQLAKPLHNEIVDYVKSNTPSITDQLVQRLLDARKEARKEIRNDLIYNTDEFKELERQLSIQNACKVLNILPDYCKK